METNWILGKKRKKKNKKVREQKNKKPSVITNKTKGKSKDKVIIVRNTRA